MKKAADKQTGFSLLEVLFSVMVLSLGMVFVASMFPLGLMNSREVAESTVSMIDAHNSAVMLEVKLEELTTLAGGVDVSNGDVHLLVKPNAYTGDPCVVLDDPEAYNPTTPLFWEALGQDESDEYVGDIGHMVVPAVDETDREVQAALSGVSGYDDPTDPDKRIQFLHPELFKAALARNYSWSALYRCTNSIAAGGAGNRFVFYVFTLKNSNKQARYALQADAVRPSIDLKAQDADMDRRFPVAWLVDLGNDEIVGWPTPMIDPFLDRFAIDEADNEAIVNILRADSVIVDADRGHVYQVQEIQREPKYGTKTYKFVVRLRTELLANMRYFWVFPPAITEHGSGTDPLDDRYADQQPVVNVVQKTMSF